MATTPTRFWSLRSLFSSSQNLSDALPGPVLQPPADGVQPFAVVFEILRPGDRGNQHLNTDVFNGLLLLSAQFVRIATNDMLVNTNGTVVVSVHRVQIATGTTPGSGCTSCFVSAHRLQIATANVHKAPRADLWNAL